MTEKSTSGQCLCGDVQFEVRDALSEPVGCHCYQCRQWTGHYSVSVRAPQDRLVILKGDESLAWFPTSNAERGFCVICGSNLFWRLLDPDAPLVGISAGALKTTGELVLKRHIYTAEQGDYYQLSSDDEVHEGPFGG